LSIFLQPGMPKTCAAQYLSRGGSGGFILYMSSYISRKVKIIGGVGLTGQPHRP